MESSKPKQFSRRIVGAFVFLLLILITAGLYYYFYLSWPIGRGPTGPTVPSDSFKKQWRSQPVLLVGIGDSVTAGFGARKNYSYFDLLITNPPDEFAEMKNICLSAVFPNLRATNLSISGSTSFQHLEKELPRLSNVGSNTFGIVVMTTGGNDLIHNYGKTAPNERAMYGSNLAEAKPWIANFSQRLERMLQKIKSEFPGGCQIFIADIFDPTDEVGDISHAGLPQWPDGTKILAAYNQVIYEFADRHPNVHVVHMHDAFLGHGIHCAQFWSKYYHSEDPHYWYFSNLEDPNESGYDAIRRLFLIEMAKVFASENGSSAVK